MWITLREVAPTRGKRFSYGEACIKLRIDEVIVENRQPKNMRFFTFWFALKPRLKQSIFLFGFFEIQHSFIGLSTECH